MHKPLATTVRSIKPLVNTFRNSYASVFTDHLVLSLHAAVPALKVKINTRVTSKVSTPLQFMYTWKVKSKTLFLPQHNEAFQWKKKTSQIEISGQEKTV